jgi:hypothetical protein
MDSIHSHAVVTHHHTLTFWIGLLRPHPFEKHTPCYCLFVSTVTRSSLIDQSNRIKSIKKYKVYITNVHCLKENYMLLEIYRDAVNDWSSANEILHGAIEASMRNCFRK